MQLSVSFLVYDTLAGMQLLKLGSQNRYRGPNALSNRSIPRHSAILYGNLTRCVSTREPHEKCNCSLHALCTKVYHFCGYACSILRVRPFHGVGVISFAARKGWYKFYVISVSPSTLLPRWKFTFLGLCSFSKLSTSQPWDFCRLFKLFPVCF